jgi:hypothetical protein
MTSKVAMTEITAICREENPSSPIRNPEVDFSMFGLVEMKVCKCWWAPQVHG